jgi:hypothetical protein
MKNKFTLFLFCLLPIFVLSQSQTCITIKGDPNSGRYSQLLLDSKYGYSADYSQPEIVSGAWTCNADGFPTCNFRGLFKYDVSSVPANAIITSAKLYLFAKTNNINGLSGSPTYGSANTSLLQKVTQAWTVTGTGWVNQPAATSTNQKTLAQSTSTAQNYIVDITDFVQGWVSNSATNYGMLLRLVSEQYYNSMIFNSGQAADELKPRLEICYTLPSNNCIIIKPDAAKGNFKQLHLDSNYGYSCDTAQPEIAAAAWTCNSIGFPTCNFRAVFRYDVSEVPANAVVTSAKLYLYAKTDNINGQSGNPTYGSANTSLLQKITQSWQLAGTGWANQPASTTTGQKTLAQSTSNAQDYVVDITDFVQEWVSDASKNYGMLLRLASEQYYNSMIFNSGKADDALKPKLEICYELADTCIAIKGDTNSGLFSQVLLDSKYDYSADTSQPEIVSAAWTCNAAGFPTCNIRGLFKYNLSAVPTNAVVQNAKLYLYAKTNNINGLSGSPTYGTANTSVLQKVTDAWQSAGTGWLNQPASTSINEKTLEQSTGNAQNYVVDVTDFVQDWVSHPETNYGMLLKLVTEQYYNSMIFHSGQAPDSLKPRLEICYNKGVLPVLFNNFRGTLLNNSVKLSWSVLDGTQISSTNIERSFNGTAYTTIGSVVGKNISTEFTYDYTDNSLPTSATKVFYRLKFLEKNGQHPYSGTIVFSLIKNNNSGLRVMPNPVNDKIQLSFEVNSTGNADITIVNSQGQNMQVFKYPVEKGNNNIPLNNLGNLSAGLYIIRVNINGQMLLAKIIKE